MKGISWGKANGTCGYLSEDGMVITKEEQNIWRLPAVNEAVHP